MAATVVVRKVDTSEVRQVGSPEVCGVCGGANGSRIKHRGWVGDEVVEVHKCRGCAKEIDFQASYSEAKIAFWPEDED